MAGPGSSSIHVPKELRRYLIPSESIMFVLHRHWVVLLEPTLTAVGGLGVVVLIGLNAPGTVARVVLALWLVLLARLAFHVFEWKHEIFLATSSRLMLVHGLVTRKVDIMPMTKVTDMRYDRSLVGRIFGYGVFILESAGQDQALSRVNFIPDPDRRYQEISAIIFAPADRRPASRVSPAAAGSVIPIAEPERAWWLR
jgi:uncharacterized membrane protein YdbT with pleckstrin-like domain